MKSRLLLCLGIFLAVLVGCTGRPQRPESTTELPADKRSLKDISLFIAEVERAETVVVFEGLPHQLFERGLFEVEVKRSDLVWFEGFPFYAKPLEVSVADKKALTMIALRADGHVRWSGYKLCGGYHPDYAIIWSRDGKKSGSLICFGCHEWKNFTTAGRLYEDLGEPAYTELRAVLSRYSRQRTTQKIN